MKERHWNSLVTSLRHGQCILVLGSEIPVPVLGDGVGVVDALTRKLSAELEDDNRRVIGYTLAAVAQQFEDTEGFGSNALRALAEKFYKNYADVPSAVHRALASLPFLLILTTCHDALLFEALQAAGKKPLKQRYDVRGDGRDNSNFFLPGSPESPIIYHMFGDVEEPRSLILSENDLLDFLIAIVSERPPLPNSLVRALKRPGQSFLFIGLGVKQWYLRVLLKVIVRTLELHRTASAIATEPLKGLSEVDREQTIFFYQRGTRIEFEDEEIESFLAELTHRVHAEGGFAGRAITLGPRPRVFLSYAREDSDLAARLYDALLKSHFEPWLDTESLIGGDEWDRRIQDELEATDFTLVLYTPALCRKADSYVNKEIALARSRALSVRGSFLIPLRTADIALEDRVRELGQYQEMPLRPAQFDEDLAKVLSLMSRDYQRRNR
jgi:TIR domain-containing protein/SIR2-like protein